MASAWMGTSFTPFSHDAGGSPAPTEIGVRAPSFKRSGPGRNRLARCRSRPLAEVGLADAAGARQLGRRACGHHPAALEHVAAVGGRRAPCARSARPSARSCRRRRCGARSRASRRPSSAPGRARARRASAGAARSSSRAPSPPSAARRRSSCRRAGGGARRAAGSRRRRARRRAARSAARDQPAAELEVLRTVICGNSWRPSAPARGRGARCRGRRAGGDLGAVEQHPAARAGSGRRSPSAASSCRRRSAPRITVRPGRASRARSRSTRNAAVAGSRGRRSVAGAA